MSVSVFREIVKVREQIPIVVQSVGIAIVVHELIIVIEHVVVACVMLVSVRKINSHATISRGISKKVADVFSSNYVHDIWEYEEIVWVGATNR